MKNMVLGNSAIRKLAGGICIALLASCAAPGHVHLSAERGDLRETKKMVDDGADINAKDERGNTALILAVNKRRTKIVDYLIEKGADINADGYKGHTALIAAVSTGNLDLTKKLISLGADVNALTDEKSSALYIAAIKPRLDLMEVLLTNGAETDLDTPHGKPIMEAVFEAKQMGSASVLLKHGVGKEFLDQIEQVAQQDVGANSLLSGEKDFAGLQKEAQEKAKLKGLGPEVEKQQKNFTGADVLASAYEHLAMVAQIKGEAGQALEYFQKARESWQLRQLFYESLMDFQKNSFEEKKYKLAINIAKNKAGEIDTLIAELKEKS